MTRPSASSRWIGAASAATRARRVPSHRLSTVVSRRYRPFATRTSQSARWLMPTCTASAGSPKISR
ncbi:hypothetical protein LDDCCGHA_3089 [Methylobacterium oxalidis]|nr:hypothetical protein LDDCCGHA_3089 [Methylobacterium oxalidis]